MKFESQTTSEQGLMSHKLCDIRKYGMSSVSLRTGTRNFETTDGEDGFKRKCEFQNRMI